MDYIASKYIESDTKLRNEKKRSTLTSNDSSKDSFQSLNTSIFDEFRKTMKSSIRFFSF